MKKLNGILEQYDEKMYHLIAAGPQEEFTVKVNDIVEEFLQYDFSKKEAGTFIEQWSTWVQAYRTCMETREEVISFNMGLLGGVITAARQKAWEEKEEESYAIAHTDTKYYDVIFKELYQVDYMQHKELAEKLSMTPSQLTNIMKRVADDRQHMIITSNKGKFKYYFLSEQGKKYYRRRFSTENKKETEELLDVLVKRVKNNAKHELLQYVEQNYPLQGKIRKKIYELEKELVNKEKEGNRYLYRRGQMIIDEWCDNINTVPSNFYSGNVGANQPYRKSARELMEQHLYLESAEADKANTIAG